MSNLKHLSVPELHNERKLCESYIRKLKMNLSGQEERLGWINFYIDAQVDATLPVEDLIEKYGCIHRATGEVPIFCPVCRPDTSALKAMLKKRGLASRILAE